MTSDRFTRSVLKYSAWADNLCRQKISDEEHKSIIKRLDLKSSSKRALDKNKADSPPLLRV
jgi:hypothetical protein